MTVVLADGRVIIRRPRTQVRRRLRLDASIRRLGRDPGHNHRGDRACTACPTRCRRRLPIPDAGRRGPDGQDHDSTGDTVARIELLDAAQIEASNRYSRVNYPVQPTLFFEFHGTSVEAVSEHARTVQEIATENGGPDFHWATTLEDREKLWRTRHDAFHAACALRPGHKPWTTDVCVPISRFAECVLETRRDVENSRLVAPLAGHAGDGNFHLVILISPDDPSVLAEAKKLNARLIERAQAMGGTCTGEHGVGIGKIKYLPDEHGEALEVMKTINARLTRRTS